MQLVTSRDVAKLLCVHINTVEAWRHKHGLPFYRFDKAVRYDMEEVKVWLKGHKVRRLDKDFMQEVFSK